VIDWGHWHNEPYLTGGLILAGWLYAIVAGPLRSRLAPGQPYPFAKAVWFYSALVLFYLAVGSPLDQVGERFLLSAHMIQHEVIMYPAPLMILLGLPAWMIDPVLVRLNRTLAGRFLVRPFTCGLLAVSVISLWHMPFLYEWTLQDKVTHVAEHLMFFAVSLLYWWPIASPSRLFPVPGFAIRVLYIIGTEVGMIPVCAYIVFSSEVLYPTYEYAPRIIGGFSPADDQLVAGILMKVVGMAVSLGALGAVFYKWQKRSELATG